MTDIPDLIRLRFMCRRGMKELDVLFARWLEQRHPTADPAQQRVFVDLLVHEDPELWAWIVGQTAPPAEFAEIVAQLRSHA